MGVFNEAQATGSYIIKSEKHYKDNAFQYWIFYISGSDEHEHTLTSDNLSESATLVEQKNAVMAILTGSIEYVDAQPVFSSSVETNSVVSLA